MTFVCDCCDKTCDGKPAMAYHGQQRIINRYGTVMGYEDVDIDICDTCSKPPEDSND